MMVSPRRWWAALKASSQTATVLGSAGSSSQAAISCLVAFFGAGGRAEGAAEDGAEQVEVAGAGGGIEDGAGLVVGEVFEGLGGFLVFGENAGHRIAGEVGGEAGEGVVDALADALGTGWVGCGEEVEAFAEAGAVLVGDGEDAVAALDAAGAAGQMRAAAEGGGGQRGVDDLDEVGHSG